MLEKYDIAMRVGRGAILAVTALAPDHSAAKFMKFGRGQRHISETVEQAASRLDRTRPTVWVHCSSLGEYGIARPVIAAVRSRLDCNVVLTFFSPTGYDALRRRQDEADALLYLPFDTAENVTHFLDAVQPSCAVFMVSEYWHNYLHALHERHIPTLLVSAIVRADGPFYKWYGSLYRESIRCFSHIFALDRGSARRLQELGVENVSLNGDPLFDNAVIVARTPWSEPVLERFACGRRVFVAGSIHPDRDLSMICALANACRDVPFIIVPHEITSSILDKIDKGIKGEVKRLSQCDTDTDFTHTRALVVDSVGSLAYLYRLGTWAYVGGGFTKRLLHSVIEPVVYGLPVAFGPNTARKVTPLELEKLGIGRRVTCAADLARWFVPLAKHPERLAEIASKAAAYVESNTGATTRVADAIIEAVCTKK